MMRKFFDHGYYIEYTQQNVKTGDYKILPLITERRFDDK